MHVRLRPRVAAVPLACAALVVAAVLVGCDGGGDDASPLLTAEQVDARETGSGTRLLQPVAESCSADGSYLWGGAGDDDVRAFDSATDGVPEQLVVGVWPMSEEAARVALQRIGPDADCDAPDGQTSMPVTIGSVGDVRARSFEVRQRDESGALLSWRVRGYTYARGHLVTVWSERVDSQPSRDRVRTLILAQVDALPE